VHAASEKVEVKAKYQTELTVSFKADEAKPAGDCTAEAIFLEP
jgi:hypothetical protein